MGNRGCLHDEQQQIRRSFVGKRWIMCLLEFKGRKRRIMTPGQYTELFFLDEATGLAAGHRPCAECQRERFRHFRDGWIAGNPEIVGNVIPSALMIDTFLHNERIPIEGTRPSWTSRIADLPDGTMIRLEGDVRPILVFSGCLLPWQANGYERPLPYLANSTVIVLTPPSTVRTLAAGYRAAIHSSAFEFVGRFTGAPPPSSVPDPEVSKR